MKKTFYYIIIALFAVVFLFTGKEVKASEEETINLYYDDRYTFDQSIESITNINISSCKTGTNTLDDNVVTIKSGTTDTVIATGCGRAEVVLADGTACYINVQAASISLILIIGQSNSEGALTYDDAAQTFQNQSILCQEGQVYNTYAPSNKDRYATVGWFDSSGEGLSNTNSSNFFPGSLTDNSSDYQYQRTYNLTDAKGAAGKLGIDSSLGNQWNQLTGEKVWLINAGHGGSDIDSWQPGDGESNNNFWQAVNLYKAAEELLDKEISAGHYTLGHKGYFWYQGESDHEMDAENYYEKYISMHLALKEELSGSDTVYVNSPVEFGGIIITRANKGHSKTSEDLELTGPRLAQYYMCNSLSEACQDIYLASNISEEWVTDQGVKEYFADKYGTIETYNKENNMKTALTELPSTVVDVHPNVHFTQIAYNELGKDAAANIIYALGIVAPPEDTITDIRIVGADGYNDLSGNISLSENMCLTAAVKVYPVYYTKRLKVAVSGNTKYNIYGITLCKDETGNSEQAQNKITFAGDNIALSINIFKEKAGTQITEWSNEYYGIELTWQAVSDASEYYIYRKCYNEDNWQLIGTVDASCYTSYLDRNVTSDKIYRYTVRVKCLDGTYTAFDQNGTVAERLACAAVNSVTSDNNSITIGWIKVKGAEEYTIYRRSSKAEEWQELDIVEERTYTDENVVSNEKYYYTVVASDRDYTGAMDNTGILVYYDADIAVVNLEDVEYSDDNSAKITWEAVDGAERYYIFRKRVISGANTSWQLIAKTKTTNYTDNSIGYDEKYTYTVRAYNGKKLGGCNYKGISIATEKEQTNIASVNFGLRLLCKS